jgi:hypothetical protein
MLKEDVADPLSELKLLVFNQLHSNYFKYIYFCSFESTNTYISDKNNEFSLNGLTYLQDSKSATHQFSFLDLFLQPIAFDSIDKTQGRKSIRFVFLIDQTFNNSC